LARRNFVVGDFELALAAGTGDVHTDVLLGPIRRQDAARFRNGQRLDPHQIILL
jgi:hypothetical protein